jgi:hypothetical protein
MYKARNTHRSSAKIKLGVLVSPFFLARACNNQAIAGINKMIFMLNLNTIKYEDNFLVYKHNINMEMRVGSIFKSIPA